MRAAEHRFAELGFASLPRIAPVGEIRTLQGLFLEESSTRRTVVHTIDHKLVQGFETSANARESLAAIVKGDWTLEFAQWYCKPAASPGASIPWHQDRAFWAPARALTLTTWIALDDVTEANGCLVVVPCSHAEPEIREHKPDSETGVPACSVRGAEEGVPMEMGAGMGFVYHERLVHRSGGNATSAARRALVLGWTLAPRDPKPGR